jgi:DNA polymerase
MLHIDFETFSTVPLPTRGAYQYAKSPTTMVLCMGYAFGDDEPELWTPSSFFPADIIEYVEDGGMIAAHNAAFERLIWTYALVRMAREAKKPVLLPTPKLEQFYCTAAQARARALPGGLDDLARCLGATHQKSRRGRELIQKLCIPSDSNGDPELLRELGEYCLQDVRTERATMQMTPQLTPQELAVYHWNERVNDTGLRVDVPFAKAATEYADMEAEEINLRLRYATNNVISTPRQYQKIKDYVLDRAPELRPFMLQTAKDRRDNVEKTKLGFDKDVRRRIAEAAEDNPDLMPADVADVVSLVDEAGRSSVSKYKNMYTRADDSDDRVRGAYIAYGAGQTGRFSSVGLQVHNMPRASAKNPDTIRRWVMEDRELPDGVMDTLSSMLRPSIIPAPGKTFVCGDWSAIEARMLPWLSDTAGGDAVLDVFAKTDEDPDAPDIYELEAARLFNVDASDVTKDQRAIGKVEVLSLGYQGGQRAFQAMARGYGISVSDNEAERIKDIWRSNNPWAVSMWADLERAALCAVLCPGEQYPSGMVTYICAANTLFCELPSGRVLSYPAVRAEPDDYGNMKLTCIKGQWKPKQDETEWPRIGLYGGLLTENITQAASADLLHAALGSALDKGMTVAGHTHDELLCETFNPEEDEPLLKDIMLDSPDWADGLPLAVETWNGKRYRK